MAIYNYERSIAIIESRLINEADILYNKDKWENGETNLLFITGLSGSGKSTLAHSKESDKVEVYELDDLIYIKDHFTMDNLKQYGDLIYSYFNGVGKKFYIGYKEACDNKWEEDDYESKLYPEFVHYAMNYAKSHKNKKFILEGVWIFMGAGKKYTGKAYFEPYEFDDYAFYIKGTSTLISRYRAAKRDSKEEAKNNTKKEEIKTFIDRFTDINRIKWYLFNEKQLNKFRRYFKQKIKNQK